MAYRHNVRLVLGKNIARQCILTVFLLLCMCQKIEVVDECDFVKCVTKVRTFLSNLQKPGNYFNCRKLSEISWCSDHCMKKYYPHIFGEHSSSDVPNFMEYCEKKLSTYLHTNWSCIARHTMRLLTCLGNVSSLTANDVRDDVMTMQSCRKSLEYQTCPSDVLLTDCGERSVEAVKDLLNFLMKYFKFSPCDGKEIKDMQSLPVHYYLEHEYMEVAQCFDSHPSRLGNCFEQYIQDEIDLNEYLCGENDYLGDCIEFSVLDKCKALPSLRRLLPKLFSFGGMKCKRTTFHFSHVSSKHPQPSVATKPIKHGKHPDSHVLNDLDDSSDFESHSDFHSSTASNSPSVSTDTSGFILTATDDTSQNTVKAEHQFIDKGTEEKTNNIKPVNGTSAREKFH